MSAIHVRTLVEALDAPGTVEELVDRTGYSIRMVMLTIWEARRDGYSIFVMSGHARGDPAIITLRSSPE